jgi:hypothetical protein
MLILQHIAGLRLPAKRKLKFPTRPRIPFDVFIQICRDDWPINGIAQFFSTHEGRCRLNVVVGWLHGCIEVQHGVVNRECVLVELKRMARPRCQLPPF